MKLPAPHESLAGCVWLPRILAKARCLQQGDLSPDYAARFCAPTGVDGLFLNHFKLTREDIVAAATKTDSEVAAWFRDYTTSSAIEQWNHLALNLGRPGFPMAERFSEALSTTYKNVDPRGKTSVFEVLAADESDA